jgi:hypothetical protein
MSTLGAGSVLPLHQKILQRFEPSLPKLAVVLQPAARIPERLRAEPKPMLPAADLPPHQACLLQYLNVFGDTIEGDGKPIRQRTHIDFSASEYAQNSSAGGVGNGPVDTVQSGPISSAGGQSFNHMVEYARPEGRTHWCLRWRTDPHTAAEGGEEVTDDTARQHGDGRPQDRNT